MNIEKCFLHYAELNSGTRDIPELEFDSKFIMIDFLKDLLIDKKNEKVFLLAIEVQNDPINEYDSYDEIIITESIDFLIKSIEIIEIVKDKKVYALQEYESYEAAYEVALMMREVNPKCYNIDNNL